MAESARNAPGHAGVGKGQATRKEVTAVTTVVVLALIVLLAPLSYYYGVDSRRLDDRGFFGAPRR
jgi:hypothetical protein